MSIVAMDASHDRQGTNNGNCGRQEGYVHTYGTQGMNGRV